MHTFKLLRVAPSFREFYEQDFLDQVRRTYIDWLGATHRYVEDLLGVPFRECVEEDTVRFPGAGYLNVAECECEGMILDDRLQGISSSFVVIPETPEIMAISLDLDHPGTALGFRAFVSDIRQVIQEVIHFRPLYTA